eukprot:Opistho-2@14564
MSRKATVFAARAAVFAAIVQICLSSHFRPASASIADETRSSVFHAGDGPEAAVRHARGATTSFPQCTRLIEKLHSYTALLDGLEAEMDALVSTATLVIKTEDAATVAVNDVCGLMHALDNVRQLGIVTAVLPVVGGEINTLSAAAAAAHTPANTLCTEVQALMTAVHPPAVSARKIVSSARTLKNKLGVMRSHCESALMTVGRAVTNHTNLCSLPTDRGCENAFNQIAAAGSLLSDATSKIKKVILSKSAANKTYEHIETARIEAEVAIGPVQNAIGTLAGLQHYLKYNPACSVKSTSRCQKVPFPCGVNQQCCGTVKGKCVCKFNESKVCYSHVCTKEVPSSCLPLLAEVITQANVKIPTLPSLDFLSARIPSFPSVTIPDNLVGLSISLPRCIIAS